MDSNKNIFILRTILAVLVGLIVIVFIGIFVSKPNYSRTNNVLGVVASLFVTPTLIPSPTNIPPSPTPTPIELSVSLLHGPQNLMENDKATFTWLVNGPIVTINISSVYYGTVRTPGLLRNTISPEETAYSERTKEFISGLYVIPLQFISNVKLDTPGTYFARAYALYNGKHYWSDEYTFEVKKKPLNEIKLMNQPVKINKGDSATFTWDILGPPNKTSYTVIVGGRQSKQGALDENTDISSTPYNTIFVKDFTNNAIDVPFRFIGNAQFTDTGTYYFRAFASINEKHIWSDEFTLSVE